MSGISRDIHVARVWEKALQRISTEGDPHAMQLADEALKEARNVWASDEQSVTATDAHEELNADGLNENLRKIRATCLDFCERPEGDTLAALSSLACTDGRVQAAIRLVLMYLEVKEPPEDEDPARTDDLDYTR